jgi:protocatechuate 3,4-dioxygenase alpha subunit
VLDGAGDPVPDALIEVWQADADGTIAQEPGSLHRDRWTFTGWGRCATDGAGHYSFTTLKPGATEEGSAPFFALTVFARGLLNRLFTRAYVPGNESLSHDYLLSHVEQGRRGTLIATDDDHGYVFDIRLQGTGETVFLKFPGH